MVISNLLFGTESLPVSKATFYNYKAAISSLIKNNNTFPDINVSKGGLLQLLCSKQRMNVEIKETKIGSDNNAEKQGTKIAEDIRDRYSL